jgi:hypothetical protein
MPSSPTPDRVPLAVWRLSTPSTDSPHSTRLQLAARILDVYGREAAFIADAFGDAEDFCSNRPNVVAFDLVRDDRKCTTGALDLVVALPNAAALDSMRAFAFAADAYAGLIRLASSQLRPGGFLIVGSIGGASVDPLTSTIAAATNAGLLYFQHVIVLAASVTSATPLTIGRCPRRPGHIDLLVFEKEAA